MSQHKSPNSGYHHLFHLNMDVEMLEVGLFQLFRNLGKSMLTLALPFYLYTGLGYEIWQICIFYAVWQSCFVVLHPFASFFIQRLGLKHSMALMTVTSSVFWLSIPIVLKGDFFNDLLFMLPIFFMRAFGVILFEVAYDIFLTHHMNRGKQGKILASLQIAILLASLLAPILGAWLTSKFGIGMASYAAVGFFMLGGTVLLVTPDEKVKVPYTPKKLAIDTIKNTPLALYTSQAGWVFYDAILWLMWPLFLVLVVDDLMSMSVLVGISSLLSMIAAYIIGKKVDKNPETAEQILKQASKRGTFINCFRAVSFIPFFVLMVDFFHKINWQSLTVPHDKEVFKWLHEKDTYERSHIRWWIIETLYLVPFLLFTPLFYFFPEGPQWIFIILFLCAGASLLWMSSVTKLNAQISTTKN